MRFLKFAGDENFSGPDGSWVIPPLFPPIDNKGALSGICNYRDSSEILPNLAQILRFDRIWAESHFIHC